MTTDSPAAPRSVFAPSRRGRMADPLFRVLVIGSGMSVFVILAWMIGSTTFRSIDVFVSQGWQFFTSVVWRPGPSRDAITGEYGALGFLYGTVVSSLIALVLAVPLAVMVALYLNELAPKSVRRPLVYAVELLAAVPSIVYGLWGRFFFVPVVLLPFMAFVNSVTGGVIPLFGQPTAFSIFSFGVVLAIMILPIITAISREVISSVPEEERFAAYGLGATRWEVLRKVVLPRARGGIIGASMLGLGRGLGETIAAALLIGNANVIQANLFAPGQTIAAQIAIQYKEASPEGIQALIALGVALFALTIAVNMAARVIVSRLGDPSTGVSI